MKASVVHAVLCFLLAGAAAEPPPQLPRGPRILDSSYPAGERKNIRFCRSGCTFSAAADKLQRQLDNLPCKGGGELVVAAGERIEFSPGVQLVLRNKGANCDWVVIRSEGIKTGGTGELPEGQRVSPARAGAMATFVKSGSEPAIVTESGANHYRISGMEITLSPATRSSYSLVQLGDGGMAQSTQSSVPRQLVIDRCYIHGNSSADLRRAISLQSAETAVVDSYISDAHWQGIEAQAIAGWNGPGPYKIVNNHIEGAGENILFGGADPKINDLVPSDIEFRQNLVRKDPAWKNQPWGVKNLFELKNARRVTIAGNIFEYSWVSGQIGFAIVLTPRNQDGGCPWCAVEDITFTDNVVRHSAGFINVMGHDDEKPQRVVTSRILIQNNLFYDCASDKWGDNGRGVQIIGGGRRGDADSGPRDVTIDHNTILSCSSAVVLEGRPFTSIAITNNLFTGAYGIMGTGTGEGESAIAQYLPSVTLTGNVFVGRPPGLYAKHPQQAFPARLADVGFDERDSANAPEYMKYQLRGSSKLAKKNAADTPGADFRRLEHAVEGSPSPTTLTPTPTGGSARPRKKD